MTIHHFFCRSTPLSSMASVAVLIASSLLVGCAPSSTPLTSSIGSSSASTGIWAGDIVSSEDAGSRWLVGISYDKNICSGIVVGRRHILTAAHCTGGRKGQINDPQYQILLGANIFKPDQVLAVQSITPREDFDLANLAINDLAVIELTGPLPQPYTPVVVAADLADLKSQDLVTIYGAGKADSIFDGQRRTARLPFVSLYNDDRDIALSAVEKAACHGDSGGGAFKTSTQNGLELIGILSIISQYDGADGDCAHSLVSSYVNLGPYLSWLRSLVPDLKIAASEAR